MLNQVFLVGRLSKDIAFNNNEMVINIAIPKNTQDTDYIDVKLGEEMARNIANYCRKGDILGIKGKVSSLNGTIEIVAEKITFLSNGKEN